MNTERSRGLRLAALVLGFAGLFAALPVCADEHDVFQRDSVPFGRTYSEWSAAWQQWASSIPAADHPLFDTARCSAGQSGPVWFLGGRFCRSDDTTCSAQKVQRSCEVPAGKALYFPVVNLACIDGEAKAGLCGDAGPFVTQMREFASAGIDPTVGLRVTLDGKRVGDNLKSDFRVQSPVFSVALPRGNLYRAIGERAIGAGDYWGVDDGIYVMLKPLPRGKHTLNFKGTFPQVDFSLDVTYDLTVK